MALFLSAGWRKDYRVRRSVWSRVSKTADSLLSFGNSTVSLSVILKSLLHFRGVNILIVRLAVGELNSHTKMGQLACKKRFTFSQQHTSA